MNSFNDYYLQQAGSGVDIYSGYNRDNMKGDGFMGRFFGSNLIPIIRKLGPIAARGARHLLDLVDPPEREKIKKAKRKQKHMKYF